MTFSIEITDEKQLAFIERVRGKKSAEEFLLGCVDAGLRVVDMNLRNANRQQRAIPFPATKPEFKTLDVAAITDALKENNKEHPVTIEVNRLVNAYTSQLGDFAKRNGNRLPANLTVKTPVAIEQVAFRITSEVIKAAAKNGQAPEGARVAAVANIAS